jgi:hypothetical protein
MSAWNEKKTLLQWPMCSFTCLRTCMPPWHNRLCALEERPKIQGKRQGPTRRRIRDVMCAPVIRWIRHHLISASISDHAFDAPFLLLVCIDTGSKIDFYAERRPLAGNEGAVIRFQGSSLRGWLWRGLEREWTLYGVAPPPPRYSAIASEY